MYYLLLREKGALIKTGLERYLEKFQNEDYNNKKGFRYARNLYFGLQIPPEFFGYTKQDFETDWSPKATVEFLDLFNDPDINFEKDKPDNHYSPKICGTLSQVYRVCPIFNFLI